MKYGLLRGFGFPILFLVFMAFGAAPAMADETVDLGIITVATQQEAEQIRGKLAKGASFEETARKYSQGPAVSRGGRVGRQNVKSMRLEYRNAIKGLTPNKPSAVVPVEDGYAVLMRFDQPRKEEPSKKKVNIALLPQTHFQPKVAPLPELRPQDIEETPGYLKARRSLMACIEAMVTGDFQAADKKASEALGYNPYEESAAFLKQVCDGVSQNKYKKSAAVVFGDGFMALNDGDAARAGELFARAYKQDPALWQARLFEANMIAGQGDEGKARKMLEDLLAKKSDIPEAYLSLGIMDVYAMKPKQAKVNLEKALELRPTMAQALYQMGQISVMEGNAQKAEGYFRSAIAANPYFEEAYNDLGLIYMHLGRKTEAEKSFHKALSVNPSFALPHLSLGNLYAQEKQFNKAIDEYNKALELDPTMAPAHFNAALAYINLGDWQSANGHARKAAAMGMAIPPQMEADLKKHNR